MGGETTTHLPAQVPEKRSIWNLLPTGVRERESERARERESEIERERERERERASEREREERVGERRERERESERQEEEEEEDEDGGRRTETARKKKKTQSMVCICDLHSSIISGNYGVCRSLFALRLTSTEMRTSSAIVTYLPVRMRWKANTQPAQPQTERDRE